MILHPTVRKFIKENDDLIDVENWYDLLIVADAKLTTPAQKQLVEALESTLSVDLGETQWELIYDHFQDALDVVKYQSLDGNGYFLETILLYLPRYGLSLTEVMYGLLDDASFEWEKVIKGGKEFHKLIDYKMRPK